jgi:hypothetical protein
VIDTTGSFSPARLCSVVLSRLQQTAAHYGNATYRTSLTAEEQEEQQKQAIVILDRVAIMRVFDIYGVIEAVDELRKKAEARTKASSEDGEGTQEDSDVPASPSVQQIHEAEIADSQDSGSLSPIQPASPMELTEDTPTPHPTGEVGLIVIDSITNVISPLLPKTHGQALLTSFTRSLAQFSTQYRICTILLNSAVGTTPLAMPRPKVDADEEEPQEPRPIRRTPKKDENVSIFAGTTGRQALGRSFGYCVDLSLFVSKLPERRNDAEAAVTGEGNVEEVCVLEVSGDRKSGREGRWGVFEVSGVELREGFSWATRWKGTSASLVRK